MASDTSTCWSPPLLIISTLSPIFKFDLSGVDDKNAVPIPEKLLIWKVHDVLYIHELKNVSFLFFTSGFGTTSPKFLTEISSPSVVTLDVDEGITSKFDNTPVILNSTFFVISPFSYPK